MSICATIKMRSVSSSALHYACGLALFVQTRTLVSDLDDGTGSVCGPGAALLSSPSSGGPDRAATPDTLRGQGFQMWAATAIFSKQFTYFHLKCDISRAE